MHGLFCCQFTGVIVAGKDYSHGWTLVAVAQIIIIIAESLKARHNCWQLSSDRDACRRDVLTIQTLKMNPQQMMMFLHTHQTTIPATKQTRRWLLIQEQINDPTLTDCWSLARNGKGGYYIKNGMLFHLGMVAGQNCEQLCVPTVRRPHVLNLAHEVFDAHLGASKTKNRIAYVYHFIGQLSGVARGVRAAPGGTC